MARKSGLEVFVRAVSRAAAAAQREREGAVRAQLTQARQLQRQARMARNQQLREAREADRLPKQEYLEDRVAETNDLNKELSESIQKLNSILVHILRASVTADCSVRETGLGRLRVIVTTRLKCYKYPPDKQEEAAETVLRQAEGLSTEWAVA